MTASPARPVPRHARLPLALAMLLALAAPLDAQDFRLRGRVIAEGTLEPLAGADVVLLGAFTGPLRETTTDSLGIFEFRLPGDGGYRLRAEYIGYRRTISPIVWTDRYDYTQVEIRLDTEAVLLAPIEITARAGLHRSPVLDNVRHRVGSGFGRFITRAEIERLKPAVTSDLLRRFPGVQIATSGRGTNGVVYMRERGCPANIFLDGMRVTRGDAIMAGMISVDAISVPQDIEVIEVFSGIATTPAEFHVPESARCGVVTIWTRRGG